MARCGERRRNMQESGFSISSSEAPLDSHILLLHSLPCPLPALQAYHGSCAAAASAGAGACAIAERFRLRRRGSASGPTARRARASAMLSNTNARWHAKGLTVPAIRAACGRQALVLLEHRPPHLAVAGKLISNPLRITRSVPTERRCPHADWLASLRAIVLERSSGSNHRPAASSRPLAPPPPLQAGPASNGLGAARSASDRKQRAPTKTCVHQKAAQTELFRDDRAEDDELGMADEEENGQARLFRAGTS